MNYNLPVELGKLQEKVKKSISPIMKTNDKTSAVEKITSARLLTEDYFIYFLFVELLDFENYGRVEKTAWSITSMALP